MTAASQPTAEVMPALGLLAHSVRVVTPEVSVLIDTPPGDVVLVDARHTLAEARGLCRLLQTTGVPVPAYGRSTSIARSTIWSSVTRPCTPLQPTPSGATPRSPQSRCGRRP